MDCTVFTHSRQPHDWEASKDYNNRLTRVVIPGRKGKGRVQGYSYRLPRNDGQRRVQLDICREVQYRIEDTDAGCSPAEVGILARERREEAFRRLVPPHRRDESDSGYASTHRDEEAFQASQGRRHHPRKGIREHPEPVDPRDGTPIPELPRRDRRQETRDEEGRSVAEKAAIFEAQAALRRVGLECWVSPSGKTAYTHEVKTKLTAN
jgi:hypothetical protein